MKRVPSILLLTLAPLGACSDSVVAPEDSALHTLTAEAPAWLGDASAIQAALDEAATSSTLSVIRLEPGAIIDLAAPLTYTGSAPLHIDGRGAVINGPAAANALEFTGGADLRIDDLTVQGAGEHGIWMPIPAQRSGTVRVELRGVTAADHGFAGVWIDDQVGDSPAGLDVLVDRSVISGNNTAGVGQGTDLAALADKDGLRVNEGGLGDLRLVVRDSWFGGNQADALELDETGEGDVLSDVRHSWFVGNGAQEQFPEDLEDGFDIDEAGPGSIYASFVDVVASGNEDEGIDLDEAGDGDIVMTGNRIVADDNLDEGIKLTEEDGGDLHLDLRHVEAMGSRDSRGMRAEELGDGALTGRITGSTFADNDNDGLRLDEEDAGAMDVRVQVSAFTGNGGDGLQATGNGVLTLVGTTFDGNDNDTDVDGGIELVTQGG